MEEHKAEWKPFFYPDPEDGDPDPPTWDEIQILQEFVERYGTANAVPVDDAAHRFMSLRNEDDLIQERQSQAVDKGERVSWLLWDAAIEMPNYQPAVLRLVEAIRALPDLDRTEEQVRTSRFQDRLEDWRNLAVFKDIWEETHDRAWLLLPLKYHAKWPSHSLILSNILDTRLSPKVPSRGSFMLI